MDLKAYFKGSKREHLLGLLGGAIWMAGAMSIFGAMNSSAIAPVGPVLNYVLGNGAISLGTLWGLVVWQEYQGSGFHPKLLLTGMFLFFGAGLTAVAVAPSYGQ